MILSYFSEDLLFFWWAGRVRGWRCHLNPVRDWEDSRLLSVLVRADLFPLCPYFQGITHPSHVLNVQCPCLLEETPGSMPLSHRCPDPSGCGPSPGPVLSDHFVSWTSMPLSELFVSAHPSWEALSWVVKLVYFEKWIFQWLNVVYF